MCIIFFFLTPLEKACISNVISGPTYPIASPNFLSVSLHCHFTYCPIAFHDLLSVRVTGMGLQENPQLILHLDNCVQLTSRKILRE